MLVAGCGGSGSLEQPVPTTVVFNTGGVGGMEILVTRGNNDALVPNPCTLTSQPAWCTNPALGTLKFDVQPSYTLYRVYVKNTTASCQVASVRVTRKGTDKTLTKAIPAGSTIWFWEIGLDTVKEH